MKKVVDRERNRIYYRIVHWPIWVWAFFILPGHLTQGLFSRGPDRRHMYWLAVVAAACGWRGILGRLPGVEPRPYVTHYGLDQPNLPYRVICYTAAWIDLLVPFSLNALALVFASFTGDWIVDQLYAWLYYPLALAVVAATFLDRTPRARRSTRNEGAERAWFYVAIWTVVPTQLAAWAAWRLAGRIGVTGIALARTRLAVFSLVAATSLLLGLKGLLPRSARFHLPEGMAAPAEHSINSLPSIEN